MVCALILPANFSTSAMVFISACYLMFIGRMSLKFIFGIIVKVRTLLVFKDSIAITFIKLKFETQIPRATMNNE